MKMNSEIGYSAECQRAEEFDLANPPGRFVFMLHSMAFNTGIDLAALLKCRQMLHNSVPDEPMFGHVAKAGIPGTFYEMQANYGQ